ncbi:MMPL family transporter [Parabacteroides sp. OttesenSCG-928-N08]|nr:MMPL family transporter [Parabacteroides sp. OttesenSCG-928-N08]
MTSIALAIYRYFQSHKAVFYIILLATTAFFGYFGSKITFEEDISKLLPTAEEGGSEELVFSNLKVKDKIFLLFHPKEGEMAPDDLIAVCDEFVETLLEKDTVYHSIQNILSQVDPALFQDAVGYLYDNVPLFLEADQYALLDSFTQSQQIDRRMEENYNLLRSPAGMAYRGIIPRDPIALRDVFLNGGMAGLTNGLGGSFTLYNNHFFTSDTTVAIAFLSPSYKSFDSKRSIRLAELIEEEMAQFQQTHPEVEILYHGAPVQSVYNSKQIKKDLLVTISISLLLVLTLLLFCFRNKSTIWQLLLPVGWGVLFALAVVYLIKGTMSLMAMGIGAIVMGVAFSYCMHVITHFKYVNDPEVVLKDQTVPVILGSLTTIGAFMGLMLTKSELLQDFGLFASLGIVGTSFFCLVFLPHLFNTKTNRKSDKAFRLLEKINSYPFEQQKWLIALLVAISGVCFYFSGDVQFDSDLRNIGYNEPKVVRSRDLLNSKSGGEYETVYFASVASDLDSALYYNRILCQRLDKLVDEKAIAGYSSPASLFHTAAEQQERIARWNDYWTEDKRKQTEEDVAKAAADNRFNPALFTPFFDMLSTEYQPASLYEAGVIPEEILANIIEYTDDRYMVFVPVQMDKQILLDVGNRVVQGMPQLVVIDPMYYSSNMVSMIHDDFNITLTISSLFVFLVLLLAYRNLLLALIAFLPMGLSWYIVLGTMALFGLQFNLINIVISAFIFGIGVDYSIFVMDGLMSKYRATQSILVYHKTAILLSAVILITVTSSLLFAVHPAIASIGVATLIGMSATILIAYTLLPFLFNLMVTWRVKRGKYPLPGSKTSV